MGIRIDARPKANFLSMGYSFCPEEKISLTCIKQLFAQGFVLTPLVRQNGVIIGSSDQRSIVESQLFEQLLKINFVLNVANAVM